MKEFIDAKRILSINGWLVFDPSDFGHSEKDMEIFWEIEMARPTLCNVHENKVRNSEWVLVLDVGGYIGHATSRQIKVAQDNGIPMLAWSADNWRTIEGPFKVK